MKFSKIRPGICLFAFFLAGCIAAEKKPETLSPDFASLQIRRVALLPVEFRDYPIDRFFQVRIAEEIRWQARRILENKGYEVHLVGPANLTGLGQPAEPESTSRSALSISPESEAVLLLQVDQFLDAGIYDQVSLVPLEIHATGLMMLPGSGEVVWKDEGTGRGNIAHGGTGPRNLDWFVVPADLAESLFTTLPPAS